MAGWEFCGGQLRTDDGECCFRHFFYAGLELGICLAAWEVEESCRKARFFDLLGSFWAV